MPINDNHAWVVRDSTGQGWSVVSKGGLVADGFPTRATAREAAAALNGRRLMVTRAWKTAGRQWLLTTAEGKLVGTYTTRDAARRARDNLC